MRHLFYGSQMSSAHSWDVTQTQKAFVELIIAKQLSGKTALHSDLTST
jgi:hypothetical protein